MGRNKPCTRCGHNGPPSPGRVTGNPYCSNCYNALQRAPYLPTRTRRKPAFKRIICNVSLPAVMSKRRWMNDYDN